MSKLLNKKVHEALTSCTKKRGKFMERTIAVAKT